MNLADKNRHIEFCALLLGEESGDEAKVVECLPVENAERSPVSFSVSPEDLFRVYRYAEERGMEIVAVFHSHPAPSRPSMKDLQGMERWPIVWIIRGVDGVKAYKLVDDGWRAVDIVQE